MTITERQPDALERLERLVANLEGLFPGVGVTPHAAVNPDGSPGNVAAGELIEAAWGNAVANTITGLPRGVLARVFKAADQGGFGGGTEYDAGLPFAIPATPTGRMHHVMIDLKINVTTAGAASNILGINLRAGSVAGTVVGSINMPFPALTTNQINASGWIQPTGLTPGGTYVVSCWGDGAGRFTIKAGSMSALFDVT